MQKKSPIFLISALVLSTVAALCMISKQSNKDKVIHGLGSVKDRLQGNVNHYKIIPCCEKFQWKSEENS